MGCDIHTYAEVLENGEWKKVGQVFDNPYYRADEETTIEEDGYVLNAPKTDHPYRGRNYDLFAILADVRNGYGFAGVPTGTTFNPISEPRGLPNDVSDEVKQESDAWGCDGHSHSHILLSELLAFDWNSQHTIHTGIVHKEQYRNFATTGSPYPRSGAVWGRNIVEVSNDTILTTPDDDGNSYVTRIYWKESYAEAVGDCFLGSALDNLKRLGDEDSVRIVFWFDN